MRAILGWVTPRSWVRGAFLVFFAFLCWRLWAFYLWAVGQGPHVPRPEAVAGLIPVGAYMSFFAWLKTGVFDVVVPAGVVIILGALAVSVLLKRGFCGWICPVGTVWEALGWAGRALRRAVPGMPKWFGRHLPVPRRGDLTLRGLRYALAAMVFVWLAALPVQQAFDFQRLPYYAVADIKILSLLVRITPVYLGVAALFGLATVAFGNVWCRYVCPLGGLYGACGTLSACTVVRDAETCIECRKCAKVCHAGVRVDRLASVHAPECDGCLDCVIACPEPGALTTRAFGRVRMPWRLWPVLVVGTWLLVYGVAVATGHWHTGLPDDAFVAYIRALGI